MKTGLRFYDRNVVQNANKTVVIEKAHIAINDVDGLSNAYRMIPRVGRYIQDHPLYRTDKYGSPHILFTGKGISKCAPEDVYDKQTGFNIADTRAQKDIFKQAYKFYKEIARLIESNFYDDITDKMTATDDSIYRCIDHEHDITYTFE